MTRGVDVRTGATGYRDQLRRVRRYLARVLDRDWGDDEIAYQDDVWSFFQNCWHLKDWVRNDPLLPQDVKDRVVAAVEASITLAIANDMANGTKHLKLHNARAPAAYSHTRIVYTGKGPPWLECMIEVNGSEVLGSIVAQQCVEEWERILLGEQLPIDRSW